MNAKTDRTVPAAHKALVLFMSMILALLVSGCGGTASETTATAPLEEKVFSWELAGSKVISPGQTQQIAEGLLTTGYQVEATATAREGSELIPAGTFKAQMTVFTPSRDMNGQVAGRTYISGSWSIVEAGATPEEIKARYSIAKAKGTLEAEVAFNPLTQPGDFAAAIHVPMSPNGGRWARGEGTFNGNGRFEGVIYGAAERWPMGSTV